MFIDVCGHRSIYDSFGHLIYSTRLCIVEYVLELVHTYIVC